MKKLGFKLLLVLGFISHLTAEENYILLKLDVVEADKKPTKEWLLTNIDNIVRRTSTEKIKYITGGEITLNEYTKNQLRIKQGNTELVLTAGFRQQTESSYKLFLLLRLSYPFQENVIKYDTTFTMNYTDIKIIDDYRPLWIIIRIAKFEPEYVEEDIGTIGAILGIKDGYPVILEVLSGSTASEAGLKINDRIIEIDDISTFGKNLQEIIGKIRGKPYTLVKLKILPSGSRTAKEVLIQRKIYRK